VNQAPVEPIRTHVAHAEWGVNRYFGFAVPDLLRREESLAGLLALAVRGRPLSLDEQRVVDDIAVAMTLADPRVWPLKLARLVSSYGRCLPGLAAGLLCLEEARIGPWTFGAAADLLQSLSEEAGEPTVAAMLAPVQRLLGGRRHLPGFLVPFRPRCERLQLLREAVIARRRHELPWWAAMEAFIAAVRQLEGPEPNVGIGAAAACLDLGFTSREIAILATGLAQTEFLSNAAEGSRQRAPVLQRLPDDRVRYVGAPPRMTPRAQVGAAKRRDELEKR